MYEIPQAANRVVGVLGLGRCAVDRVVGAELSMARKRYPYGAAALFGGRLEQR